MRTLTTLEIAQVSGGLAGDYSVSFNTDYDDNSDFTDDDGPDGPQSGSSTTQAVPPAQPYDPNHPTQIQYQDSRGVNYPTQQACVNGSNDRVLIGMGAGAAIGTVGGAPGAGVGAIIGGMASAPTNANTNCQIVVSNGKGG